MSAGRFEWEATRFEHVDETTGARLVVVKACDAKWTWMIRGVDSGVAASPSSAKGAARKALDAFKVNRVSP